MFTDEDLLPISGLRHLAFCERRWVLVHMEMEWDENVRTIEGKQLYTNRARTYAQACAWLGVFVGAPYSKIT